MKKSLVAMALVLVLRKRKMSKKTEEYIDMPFVEWLEDNAKEEMRNE